MNRSFSFFQAAGAASRRGVLLAVPAWFFLAVGPGQAAKGEWVSQGRGAVWKPAAETSASASGSKSQRVSKSKSKGKGKTGSRKRSGRSVGSWNSPASSQGIGAGYNSGATGSVVNLPGGSGSGNTHTGGGTDITTGAGLGNGTLISGGTVTSGGNLGGGGVTTVSQNLLVSNVTTLNAPINVSSITFGSAISSGSGSQLNLTAANQINDSAAIHMNGATLHTGGFNERVGILTLSGNNVVDLGTGASVLRFADSSSATWGGMLSVRNWTGNLAGGGMDQLFFGTTGSGLTSSQLAHVSFIDPAGLSLGTYGSTLLESGELVPQAGFGMLTLSVGSGVGILGGFPGIVTSPGTIAPGNSPGTLSNLGVVGFDNTSVLNFELSGTDQTVGGVNDLFTGITHLTLNGTLNVSEFTSGSFLSADLGDSWRLYNYSGALTDQGLSLGDLPSLRAGLSFALNTAVPGQVNLVVVPEPGAAGLLALAGGVLAGGVLAGGRRRRSGKPD